MDNQFIVFTLLIINVSADIIKTSLTNLPTITFIRHYADCDNPAYSYCRCHNY